MYTLQGPLPRGSHLQPLPWGYPICRPLRGGGGVGGHLQPLPRGSHLQLHALVLFWVINWYDLLDTLLGN